MLEERYRNNKHIENVPDWHIEESSWKVRHIMQILEHHQITPKTVCELGCGFGEVL